MDRVIYPLYYFYTQFNLRVPSELQSYFIDRIPIPQTHMSTTTNSTKTSQRTLDFHQKYKTQRCRYWYERGFCPFNQICAFAHAEQQLRGKGLLNQHYKTKVCANFKNNGFCKYGERCQFLHLLEAPSVYARPYTPSPATFENLSEKGSDGSVQSDDKRHQKQLSLLSDYGLEVLAIKKAKRSQHWRSFLADGIDPFEAASFQWEQFEQQFDDYDFKRKPRLGSM